MEKYRIDRAYEKIYSYDNEAQGFVFYCTFFAAGVDAAMTDEKIVEKLEANECHQYKLQKWAYNYAGI